MNECYVIAVGSDFSPEPDEDVMESIFKQYERIIVESLITSFGLDFIVKDRHGGDVDTINNVRKIGIDHHMAYKNESNKNAYDSRGEYNDRDYKKNSYYKEMQHAARDYYRSTGRTVEDAYTGSNLHFLGKSKGANPKINAELDHVIATKAIHDDRGRVLSGVNGKTLADLPENLRFTNKSLNASMQDVDIPDYIEKHPELPSEVKAKMMSHYNKARSAYEAKLQRDYYTSSQFAKDVTLAAGSVGFKMGIRQALGFVLAEMWFSVKEEFEKVGQDFDLGILLTAIGNGIQRGSENAKDKYKEVFDKFKEGSIAGVLSSLTTTLSNIFFTTAKNVVKVIRQSYASLVQAGKVLFVNPDNLLFGERMCAVIKILATGASVVAGSFVADALSKTPIAGIPEIGDVIQTFCGALVTGILSCTLLYFFDRSEVMNKLVATLNNIHTIETEVNYFYRQVEYFEKYAAELMDIDLEKFKEETQMYSNIVSDITEIKNEAELNILLKKVLTTIGVEIPWEGDFDSFMSNKNSVLVFE